MITTNEMSDKELLKEFENCSLDPNLVSHEVLLRISWILINKYGLETAITKNCEIKEN